jgi:hypothetical protein
MKNKLPAWSFGVLAVAGLVLAGSMILDWVSFGGVFTARGYEIALENKWMWLVPVAGAVLFLAAVTRSEHARLAAIFGGLVVTGYTLFELARSMINSGLDTWLILGGAGAMLAGASKERVALRALGGLAVLAGFFAPWESYSMFDMLRGEFRAGLRIGGTISYVLWLIPLAGVAGVLSAGNRATGGRLAAGAGITVYGSILLVVGAAALLVFGLGAWAALGASTVALVVGVLARVRTSAVSGALDKP